MGGLTLLAPGLAGVIGVPGRVTALNLVAAYVLLAGGGPSIVPRGRLGGAGLHGPAALAAGAALAWVTSIFSQPARLPARRFPRLGAASRR